MRDLSANDLAIDLLNRHASLLDNDKLEAWVDLFTDDAVYQVIPRENYDLGLPVALIQCDNKRMLADRIVALRTANEYNLHYARHLVSTVQGIEQDDGSYVITANYAVYQTTMEGTSRLFSVGGYLDKAVLVDGRLMFTEKRVIVDFFSVPTLLATPL